MALPLLLLGTGPLAQVPAWSLPLRLAGAFAASEALAAAGPCGARPAHAVCDTLCVDRLITLAERTAATKNVRAGRQHAAKARQLARRIGYVAGEMNSIRIGANLDKEGGQFAAAIQGYNEGIELARKNKLTCCYETFYASLGACALEMEQYPYAVNMLQTSLKYRRLYPACGRDTTRSGAAIHAGLAKAYLELKDYDAAMTACRRTFKAGSNAPGYADVEVIMAELYRVKSGRGSDRAATESALTFLRSARDKYHRMGDRHKESLTLLALSKFLATQNQPAESGQAAAAAGAYARQLRAVPVQVKALEYEAQAAVAQRDYRRAYELQRQAAEKKDALFNQEKALILEKQEVRFNLEKLAERNRYLTQQSETNQQLAIAQKGKVTALGYLLGASALFLLVGSFIYWRLRRKGAQLSRAYGTLDETNGHLQVALEDISQRVEEKEVLVQEVHHRVKNNLQLVRSLLGWQSSVYPDPALVEALACSQARIQSMALVHELLYSADNLAEVRLDSYVTKLLDTLHESFNSENCPVTITTDLQAGTMTAQQVTPFGLLVNELVTNAYKHAFRGRPSGQMRVELRPGPAGPGFELVVSDNGVGMPDPSERRRESLGTHLVEKMADQLKATCIVGANPSGGTRFVIRRGFDLTPTGQAVTAADTEKTLQ